MNTTKFTQKEKELIATGISIAAGCQPCTTYHFDAVREAGATEEEISQAVADALCVRNSATKTLKELTERLLENAPEAEEYCCSSKPLIGELVSIGAAYAVNCTTNMASHLEKAKAMGASEQQIKLTVEIARSIKNIAEQKVDKLIDPDTAEEECGCNSIPALADDCGDNCGCNE